MSAEQREIQRHQQTSHLSGVGYHEAKRGKKTKVTPELSSINIQRNEKCFTDGNGPEVFQPCSGLFVGPQSMQKDRFGRFIQAQFGCTNGDPPSMSDEICHNFYDKIENLK